MINRITPKGFNSSMRSREADETRNEAAIGRNNSISAQSETSAGDMVAFNRLTKEDLTSDGKIPVIISNREKTSLAELKDNMEKEFTRSEASLGEDLPLIDGVQVNVDPRNIHKLIKNLPKGSNIVIDTKIKFPIPSELNKYPKEGKDRPSLDIANSTLGMNRLWDQGLTGKGIGICVIDSGIHPHRDFEGRIKEFVDMNEGRTKPYDPYGHGTHVAGIAAGSGAESLGKFKGVAPDADIIGVRITSVSEAIKGIQWAIENKDRLGIKVLNLSLGDFPIKSHQDDPWAQAAEKAWDSGIVVVVAAGNEGPGEGTISTPGIAPKVITVGAIDDKNTPGREDDTMSLFSSRGPTVPDKLSKPDVVAPGVDIFGPLSPDSTLDDPDLPRVDQKYVAISGSSMATPIVAGLSALLIQANPDLGPDEIKQILMETADQYIPNAGQFDQGAGLIDPVESLQVAMGRKKPAQVAEEQKEVPMHMADEVLKKA